MGIILINSLTVGLPFIPAILFRFEEANGHKRQQLEEKLYAQPDSAGLKPNRLIMPTALFDEPVHEGSDARTLQQGVWRRPNGSIPGNGNTVLVAHRFTYTNPRGAFYNLDKVKVGDTLALIWNNHTLQYVVRETKVVGPRDTHIEDQTRREQLTLYTCTPLTLPKNRLVVIATPKGAADD